MEPQQDIAAIFVCLFHDLHGQVLSASSVQNDDVDLTGIEFSALPSGLHLVEEDVVFFDHNGLMGQVIFINEKSDDQSIASGSRGRKMWSVGVLVAPKPSQPLPAFHHLPFVREAAAALSSSPDDFSLLRTYFDIHRSSSSVTASNAAAASSSSIPTPPKAVQLLGSPSLVLPATELALLSDLHPLSSLPHLMRTVGPSITTLYKFSLAGARILFYTKPPLRTGCEFAWCVWALGQRERIDGSMGDEGSRYLGSVGLMDMGRLEGFARTESERGWIGCTTDALFKERPHLYDLLIDLSSPLPIPPIFLSPPPSTPSPSPRLLAPSSSSLPLYNRALVLLEDPTHSHPHPNADKSGPSALKQALEVCWGACEWCLGMVLGRAGAPARIRLPSSDPEDEDDSRSSSSDNEESDSAMPTTGNSNPNPTPLALLHLFTHETRTLNRSVAHLVAKRRRNLPSGQSEVVLGAREMMKLGLGVGEGDVRVVRRLANLPAGPAGMQETGKKRKGRKGKKSGGGDKAAGEGQEGKVRVEVGRWWSWVPGMA